MNGDDVGFGSLEFALELMKIYEAALISGGMALRSKEEKRFLSIIDRSILNAIKFASYCCVQ
jgi:hypothetical protein